MKHLVVASLLFTLSFPFTVHAAGWVDQSSGATYNIEAIDGSGVNYLMAITSLDTVLVSTDAGVTWASETTGSVIGQDVEVTSSSTAYVVGSEVCGFSSCGFITKTTDFGGTWTEVLSGTSVDPFYDITMYSTATGWAVGYDGQIRKTTDSGSTWNPQTSGVTEALRDIDFVSSTTGLAVCDRGTNL